jgi:hypothetical protein
MAYFWQVGRTSFSMPRVTMDRRPIAMGTYEVPVARVPLRLDDQRGRSSNEPRSITAGDRPDA